MRGNLDQPPSMFPRIKALCLLLFLLLCSVPVQRLYSGSEVLLLVNIYLRLGLPHVDV